MKNLSVILLAVVALAFSAYAEAAKPRKRTRNANRIGPYAVGQFGQTTYSSETADDEALATEVLLSVGGAAQDITVSTEDSDIGYQAAFGYRFTRYIAAELSLLQLGEMVSTARANMDFGTGPLPAKLDLSFRAGGPMVSVLGVLPINDRFEIFGRAGYLFSSVKREVQLRIDGQNGGFGSAKGDSEDLVLGVGAAVHFGQVYSLRLDYLRFDELGDENTTGTEDANLIALGVVVRF